ncbi:MAG: hypothetical protein U1E49_03775 [Hyphomicrobiaceae bacterium]
MGQILVRNLPDGVIETLKTKAELSGRSLEQTVRDIIVENTPLTSEECLKLTDYFMSRFPEPLQPLTKDEIREGLE